MAIALRHATLMMLRFSMLKGACQMLLIYQCFELFLSSRHRRQHGHAFPLRHGDAQPDYAIASTTPASRYATILRS